MLNLVRGFIQKYRGIQVVFSEKVNFPNAYEVS